MLRTLKYRLRALMPSVIFLGVTYYFAWNAVHGRSGLEAQAKQRVELKAAQANFMAVDAERQLWETKIADLSGQTITGDMLDGQARQVLNLADPDDLVIELPQNKSGK